jgi:hypothetical protein
MTKDEALKMALEALEGKYSITASMLNQQFQALTAIKEALAQPAQEPAAYCYVQKGTSVDILTFYAEPDDAVAGTLFPLYYATPQRPWIGLTEEEVTQLDMDTSGTVHDFVQAVDSKLKEKNTP